MARRLVVLTAFAVLVAAGLLSATAQDADAPTSIEASRCYECHSSAGKVPEKPMGQVFAVHLPEDLALTPGEPTPLEVTVRTKWTAELSEIALRLDLTGAPSLGFDESPPPVLDRGFSGTLTFDAASLTAPERTATGGFEVPVGATAFTVRLDATGTGRPADLALRIWPPGSDIAAPAPITVDSAGPGQSERYGIATAAQVADAGFGAWRVEVAQEGFANSRDLAALEDQPFRVDVDAWTNLTGERVAFAAVPGTLKDKDDGGPEAGTASWPLFVASRPGAGEKLRIDVELKAHYQHPAQFGAIDDWRFSRRLDVPIEPPAVEPDDPTVDPNDTIVLNLTPPPPQPETTVATAAVWRMADVSEAVGYAATFLLVSSVLTGGLLGGASKRGLNALLGGARRRIAFHNLTSYAILLAAVVHAALFIVELVYHWSVGVLWGGAGVALLLVLGVTGAFQAHLVRGLGFGAWRFLHYTSALLCLVATAAHLLLDGIHFVEVQETLGWTDPLVERFAGTTT